MDCKYSKERELFFYVVSTKEFENKQFTLTTGYIINLYIYKQIKV